VSVIAALLLLAALAAQPDPQAFRAHCGELAKGTKKVTEGAHGELFLSTQLKALSTGRFWGEAAPKTRKGRRADPLAAIIDFKAQLEARGIELLVVPVPPKAVVHPELLPKMGKFDEPLGRLDLVEAEFIAALRERGVEVLDLLPVMLARRAGPSDFCKTDHHLNGRGQVLLAQQIAEAVQKRSWLAEAQEKAPVLEATWRDVPIEGLLSWMRAPEFKIVPELIALRQVRDPKTRRPPAEDRNAPVLLMGDSCVLVFHEGENDTKRSASMLAAGAGLMEQLAFELKVPIDVAGTMADGIDAPRLALRNRERGRQGYLAGKKLVVWVFFEAALSQNVDGWRLLPLQ